MEALWQDLSTRRLDRPRLLPPAAQKILDPWGNEYLYRKGANAVNPDFDLWSKGKDGKTKTGTAAADMTSADMRDDIKNF